MAGKHSRFTLILLALIAVCVIILVVGLVIWQQQDQQVQQLKAEYDRINSEYIAADKEIKELPARQQDLAKLHEQLKAINQNLMDYQYIPTYLQQIEETARQTGNDLHSISPHTLRALDMQKSALKMIKANGDTGATPAASATPAAPATPASKANTAYQVQQISLDVVGNYVSLIRFLDALRRFPKIIYVRTINLSPHVADNAVSIEAQIETYAIITPDQYLKSPEDLTAAAKTGVPGKNNAAVVNTAAASISAAGKANNNSGGEQQ